MNSINLNNLRDRAYKCACAHGFHHTELSNEHFLCLVITELSEAVEADRKGMKADKKKFEEMIQEDHIISSFEHDIKWFRPSFETYIKDTVEDELADAVIRLLDLAGLRNINVNNEVIWGYCVDEEKTFTENCYKIIQNLSDARHTVAENINYTIKQIFKLEAFYDIDIFWHIEQKMKYNELREERHGKKY